MNLIKQCVLFLFSGALVAAIAKHSGLEEVRIKFTGSFQTNSSQSSAENDHDSDGVYVWITLLAVPPVQGIVQYSCAFRKT